MYCEKLKVFLLLFFISIFVYYYYEINIYLIVDDHGVNISSCESKTPSLSARKPNDSFMMLNRGRNYKHENSKKKDEVYVEIYKQTNIWFFGKDTRKYKNRNVISEVNDKTQSSLSFSKFLAQRNAYKRNAMRKNLPKNKQKKMIASKHLLMNNVSIKNEDNDYSKSMNKKRIYWVSFQDEGEASIMELIDFNASHTTKVYRL